jgi:hypothetical protein
MDGGGGNGGGVGSGVGSQAMRAILGYIYHGSGQTPTFDYFRFQFPSRFPFFSVLQNSVPTLSNVPIEVAQA